MTSLALCGAGHIAAVHALAARQVRGVDVTAVASRDPRRAAAVARELRARACTYDELPAGADVVLVSTPPSCHAHDTIRALQGGAAVICEKPLTATLADADRIVAASDASGGRVGYAENLAFAPLVEAALTRIAHLGVVHHLEARMLSPRPDWGDFLTEGWGGGVLFDTGSHPLALVLLAAQGARPTAVRATLEGAPDIPCDEYADVTVEFDSGLTAHVVASWRHPDRVRDLQAASATGVVRAELLPDPGLEVDGEPVALPPAPKDPTLFRLEQMGYVAQLERFVRRLPLGDPGSCDAAFGRTVLDVVCAAYASAAHGGRSEPLPFRGPRDRTPLQLWRG